MSLDDLFYTEFVELYEDEFKNLLQELTANLMDKKSVITGFELQQIEKDCFTLIVTYGAAKAAHNSVQIYICD